MATKTKKLKKRMATKTKKLKKRMATKTKKLKNLPTFEEIKKVVPKECFEKSLSRSLYYFFKDIAQICCLYSILPFVELHFGIYGLIIWYWIAGMFGFALGIVGHDCGHKTFSKHKWLNNLIGHIAFGLLMIPYWPWQKTHRLHHINAQHLEKDKTHTWPTFEKYNKSTFIIKYLIKLLPMRIFAYHLLYLLVGFPDGSHFWPWSKLFTTKWERIQCAISSAVCAIFATLIFYCFCGQNVAIFIKYYFIPILFSGYWLMMVTYLQHRDEHSEVYDDEGWTFVRGQLQTIDISYGLGVDTFLHNVTDGHLAHHLFFTRIPHYNLVKATRAIRAFLDRKYPGTYKHTNSYKYWFLLKYQWLVFKLDYLVPIGTTGIFKFRVAALNDKEVE